MVWLKIIPPLSPICGKKENSLLINICKLKILKITLTSILLAVFITRTQLSFRNWVKGQLLRVPFNAFAVRDDRHLHFIYG